MLGQRLTIKEKFSLKGIGVHSNQSAKITFHPEESGQGISFIRKIKGRTSRIPASVDNVSDTFLAVTLKNQDFFVRTVEHLLYATFICGITDLLIEIEGGSEIPALDGSAKPFIDSFRSSGILEHDSSINPYYITQTIEARADKSFIKIEPYPGFRIACGINFPHPLLKKQYIELEYEQDLFEEKIASARTFGFQHEIDKLHKQGLGLGGSVKNALVFSRESTLNTFRFAQEPLYHKILDIIGDLALLGGPVQGSITAYKSSHFLDIELTRKIKRLNKNVEYS